MPTPPSERNLLFAVLALQNELAQPDAVLAAMQAWVAAKHRSLGELLVEGGAIEPTDRQLLDALIDRQLARHGNAEQSLAALDPSSRARRLLAQVADPDVQASLAALPATDGLASTLQGEPAQAGPRYRVLRLHAEGGLGEVFVAEDLELHREVALKEIKRAHACHEDSRGRFLLEAEITGGLEHPGIVPVYGLGTYADGRPFYAMRFIQGDNLKAAIARFHAGEPVRFDSLEFRQLLGRFVDVCQAVAYAHSRGVLHRDLKPGNIMLGKFGETLVVDWGLAKVVGHSSGDGGGARDEATLRPSSGSGYAETLAGSAVGTPVFMSPEQAAGKLEDLGPATDVYSLGATLYMLLTNRPPFDGPVGEVLEQVRQGSWVPPRTVRTQVPGALDAICRKAMALRPEDRYASPLALAEDVEQWLAEEPVSAYAEPAMVRARRWVRKRPKRVTAAVVLLLAAVVGLTIGTVLLKESNLRITAAHEEAERQKLAAEENGKKAREAVDKYFTEVSEEQLLNEPGMQPLRERLLRSALEYYQRFLEKHSEDRSLRRELAEAYRRAGDVTGQLGGSAAGQMLLAEAVRRYEELLGESPADRDLREKLARSCQRLSHLQFLYGENVAGVSSAGRAIDVLEPLWAEEPQNAKVGRLLGQSYDVRRLHEHYGRDPEGWAHDDRRAVEILEQTCVLAPDDAEARVSLGLAYQHRFTLDSELKAVAIFRRLRDHDPRLASIRHGLASALAQAGRHLIDFGRPRNAETNLDEAWKLLQKLLEEEPRFTKFQQFNAFAAGRRGECLLLQGRTRPAVKLLQEAGSSDVWFRYLLGCLEGEAGNLDTGIKYCEEALKVQEELRLQPRGKWSRSYRSDSLWSREAIFRFRFLRGNINREELIAEQRKTLAERKQVADEKPREGQFDGEVGASAAVLAGLLLEVDKADQALAVLEEVLPQHKQAADLYPDRRFELHCKWAELLARQSEALARTGKTAEGAQAIRQAVDITQELCPEEPCYLYDLVRHLCLASNLAGQEVVPQAADRALQALRDYIASGFDNPYKLRTDPRLEPLRKREDFQKLVQDLEAKVKEASFEKSVSGVK